MKYLKYLFLILISFIIVGCDSSPINTSPRHIFEDLLNDIGDKTIAINEYTVYGKYFNIRFTVEEDLGTDAYFILKNDFNEISYPIYSNGNSYYTNEYLNSGINLEKIDNGDYLCLIKFINGESSVYYNINNGTVYDPVDYYTITKNNSNNHIEIFFDNFNNFEYMTLTNKVNDLPDEVYDIVLDPGHGGSDSGATNGKYKESTINLDNAKSLKEALEAAGYKVKLTREENINPGFYGAGTRTGIPYEAHAKLMLSLHLNSTVDSSIIPGVEIYTACGDEYTFAKYLADTIVKETGTEYSSNKLNRVMDGVYMRTYSSSDIKSSRSRAKELGYKPFNITEDMTYYYFIRETGGLMTKGFNDGRNKEYGDNIYRNSNIGVEAYLVELAYISNKNNLNDILNNRESYIKALVDSINYYANN